MTKVLVVIPHWDCETYAYCLDKAAHYQLSGHEVHIIDYSDFHLEVYRRLVTRLKNVIRFQNRTKSVSEQIIKQYEITKHRRIKPKHYPGAILNQSEKEYFHRALVSIMTKYTGDRNLNLKEISKKTYNRQLLFYLAVKKQLTELISEIGFSLLLTVNGRFVVDGAARRVAKDLGVECILLERGRELIGGVEEFKVSPQSLMECRLLQSETWKSAGEQKIQLAEKGLKLKLHGVLESHWRGKFLDVFEPNNNVNQKIAVFFPSTELEFALDEQINQEFMAWSQVEAFKVFCREAKRLGYKVIVRVHPLGDRNRKVGEFEDALWLPLCRETGSEFISSFSTLNSYSLIEAADLCVTYTSNIGIDCLLLEKRTLVLGPSIYSHLVPENFAQNLEEVRVRLSEKLILKSAKQLLPWGYYYVSGGNDLRLFQVSTTGKLMYNQLELNKVRPILVRTKGLLRKLMRRLLSLKQAKVNVSGMSIRL